MDACKLLLVIRLNPAQLCKKFVVMHCQTSLLSCCCGSGGKGRGKGPLNEE